MKHKKRPGFKFKNTNGIEYQLIWKAPPKKEKAYGTCEHPGTKNPKILIDPELKKYKLIEIIAHEILHAFSWDMREKSVKKFAKTVKRAIKAAKLL